MTGIRILTLIMIVICTVAGFVLVSTGSSTSYPSSTSSSSATSNEFNKTSKNKTSESFPLLKHFLHCVGVNHNHHHSKESKMKKQQMRVAFFGDSTTAGIFSKTNSSEKLPSWHPRKSFAHRLLKHYDTNIFDSNSSVFSQFGDTVFALSGSALLSKNATFIFQNTQVFEKDAINAFRGKNVLDLAFFMFGTNEAWNGDTSVNAETIRKTYSDFLSKYLLTVFQSKEVVMIIPPPISSLCPKVPWCSSINFRLFHYEILKGLRQVGKDLSQRYPTRFRMLDFNKYFEEEIILKKGGAYDMNSRGDVLNEYLGEDGLHMTVAGHDLLKSFILDRGCD